jgi:uncharacterized protein (TIGR03435 family)
MLDRNLSLGGKLILATALSFAVATSQPRRSFERISINTSAPGSRSFSLSGLPNLTVKNASLRDLIRVAYQVRDFQISGGPDWIDSAHYDIDANAKDKPNPKEWLTSMTSLLQSLLEDRFKLKLHRETRELPVYVLTVAKGGPKFQQSKEKSCTTFNWIRNSPPPGQIASIHCGAAELTNAQLNRTLDAVGISMTGATPDAPGLTWFLSRELDRIVIDKTGLTGLFDFYLEWNRAATLNKAATSADPDNPSLFTALPDQLGLKLTPEKGPVEILVIDHAEKPSEN